MIPLLCPDVDLTLIRRSSITFIGTILSHRGNTVGMGVMLYWIVYTDQNGVLSGRCIYPKKIFSILFLIIALATTFCVVGRLCSDG